MTGNQSGTDGDRTRTKRFIPWSLYGVIALFLLIVILVNISSHAIEDPKTALWEPVLWEVSSYAAIMLLTPALYFSYHRFHWRRLGLPRFVLIQAGACILFSLLHIAAMVTIRAVGYGLVHQTYNFAQGHLVLELIYEGRKDALTVLVVMGFCWVNERLTQSMPALLPDRIEIRTDGRTVYLSPAEIVYAEAAGNYVELHLASGPPLLVRDTLAAYDKRLSPYGFARIHRSRLLNRHHMRQVSSTASGDLRVTLNDGRELTGSRRFRDQLY
ncbi:LytTR family DNA-binding domain-containing protein [Asticcacaulis sp. 201]|uniref:LytR/AlgR family response regulator transcription factor n=1 Tax=Asticcacaulis sp. 201 TaxID=3028787 RepID=UPI002916F88C|nr:LytTR family DNA-binding domain-containing protein [Asticcacaulis sp. 201]MDV6332643.1 LytTR family DNA-binding domain-containing protein [Asticcacaulis sp. 201]